ncbi:DsrE family protein [Marinobacter pelagius]|uniref:DsrE family protein n=1 Tax=Marinobacter sp. C7 TaxID=2951363 RepID=UPI001EF1294C|nr:DsrE family protein [Marinobacter sp. C7]MCG7199584.1 DsrE family protein [Marinobacter sp. C7]
MSTLILIDQPPYGGWTGREALDMAFSLAAFDQPVSLLFCGAGVNWLRKGQEPGQVRQKSVEKNLSAATIFGVEALLADSDDCNRYGLEAAQLLSGVELVRADAQLFAGYSHTAFAG